MPATVRKLPVKNRILQSNILRHCFRNRLQVVCIDHGDHSPDNVKLHDISLTICGTPAHVKCYSYHVCTTKYQYGRKYAANNKQF